MGLWSLVLWSFLANAGETATGGGTASPTPPPVGGIENIPVYKALTCIQASAPDTLFHNPNKNLADCVIRQFAPALQVSIRERTMTNTEISLFISSAIEESRFFTKLVETRNLSTGPQSVCGSREDSMTNLIEALDGKASATGTTVYAGNNVGQGILQITGMDNRISALDALVQRFRLGRRPDQVEWKTYWEFPYGDNPKYQIGPRESNPKVLAAFRDWYRTNYRPGQDIDVFGLYTAPEFMSMPNIPLTDAKVGERGAFGAEQDSSYLVTEMAMYYWHNRCRGEMAKYAANHMYSGRYDPSTYGTPQGRMIRAAMKCVKGSDSDTNSLYRRQDWYNLSKTCVDKYMENLPGN